MNDFELTYDLIRSARRTIGLEIMADGKLLVRAPYRVSKAEINRLLEQKRNWILAHLEKQAQKKAQIEAEKEAKRQARLQAGLDPEPEPEKLTFAEIQKLAKEAMVYFPQKTAEYAKLVGVTYSRITIRNQRTKWGSCSGKGNLNFNCLLMLAPEHVRDYVIVHELCHRLEMNHSPRFWAQVERVMPDYKTAKEWLKVHGAELMARMKD